MRISKVQDFGNCELSPMNMCDPLLSHGLAHMSGFLRALEILENLENHEKSSMHGQIMEFEEKN